MRLINVNTLELEEFSDTQTPPYAILSHRWETEEVLFHEFQTDTRRDRAGFDKIVKCCGRARHFGLNYVWIDTCCIDKSSSAELSEAINSMYRWYQKAEVCYAYLSDVMIDQETHIKSQMAQSEWFTRGWTLQELLAPNTLEFVDRHWHPIGNKWQLSKLITEITGISRLALRNIDIASVAMKLSWASKRTTTRIEDMAYSLIGLFGVSMPLLYGEGYGAFRRLQLEVLNTTEDDSILAWGLGHDGTQIDIDKKYYQAIDGSNISATKLLLAPTPRYFAEAGDIQKLIYLDRPPYSVSHRGLMMNTQLIESPGNDVTTLIPLNCARITKKGHIPLAIGVELTLKGKDIYRRRLCQEIHLDNAMINAQHFANKISINATIAQFFALLQDQPRQTIYVMLVYQFWIPPLRLLDINWIENDPEQAMYRLGIVQHKRNQDTPREQRILAKNA